MEQGRYEEIEVIGVKERSRFELFVIAVVIVAAVIVSLGLHRARSKVLHAELLMNELFIIRSAVQVYQSINKELPTGLEALYQTAYMVNGAVKHYLNPSEPFIHDSNLVDPFGQLYAYDMSSGWVQSKVPGYESW